MALILFIQSCKSSETFSGYSYDPEGVTDTQDRDIQEQPKRTIGFLSDGVWISNEFEGARANDVFRVDEFHYIIRIDPEISPINNSPWYGFRIWSNETRSVTVELEYTDGRQRYLPKKSFDDGLSWANIDSSNYRVDLETGNGILHLTTENDPLWISAQEVFTTRDFRMWKEDLMSLPFIQSQVIGTSHLGRSINQIKISEHLDEPLKGVIFIYGRQHPPEIPGFLVGLKFIETLTADTDLAIQFRKYFDVWAFPLMNPDGADGGHWRTNAAGVDLNRDWLFFNQPETAAVRNAVLKIQLRSDRKPFYSIDFHSTGRTIFYPISRNIDTFPHLFAYRWAESIQQALPDTELLVQPFDVVSPIAKNWSFRTFGIDGVTFEVSDEMSGNMLDEFASKSAETFMRLMIEEFENYIDSN